LITTLEALQVPEGEAEGSTITIPAARRAIPMSFQGMTICSKGSTKYKRIEKRGFCCRAKKGCSNFFVLLQLFCPFKLKNCPLSLSAEFQPVRVLYKKELHGRMDERAAVDRMPLSLIISSASSREAPQTPGKWRRRRRHPGCRHADEFDLQSPAFRKASSRPGRALNLLAISKPKTSV
jgi:hypothetical protein